jgi:small subunit ribosomal protein S9
VAERQRYFYGTGRRKTAVARVRLYPGDGQWVINGKSMDDYFGVRPMMHLTVRQPLNTVNMLDRFNVSILVAGGGVNGQAGAVRHGIARALVEFDAELRPVLKRQGFLTRDPRVKERKKVGLKRARKAPQYTKR